MTCTVFPVQPQTTRDIQSLGPALQELLRQARRDRGLSGGLGACPDFAPYETPGGGCSNVPPEIDAHQYFQAGGKLDESGTIVGYEGDSRAELDCPYGSKLNPFTGRTECRSQAEAQFTTPSGYVIRASSSQSDMAAIAAAAQAEGRARGFDISCQSIPMGGDPITGEQRYRADCTVNGSTGHDAAVLLTGSGFENLATEVGVNPWFKASSGYQFISPTSQQQQSALAPVTQQKPSQPAPAATSPATAPQSKVAGPTATTTTAADKVISDVTAIAEQVKGSIASANIPTWIWYAGGAAAVGLFFLGGRRR